MFGCDGCNDWFHMPCIRKKGAGVNIVYAHISTPSIHSNLPPQSSCHPRQFLRLRSLAIITLRFAVPEPAMCQIKLRILIIPST